MKSWMALLCGIVAAGVLVGAAGPSPAPPGGVAAARLKAISARVDRSGASSLVIEASEPVGYVATRPDLLTVAVEFRNVDVDGLDNRVRAGGGGAVAGVSVEAIESMGVRAARVRVALSQDVAHRVRSDRNRVVIDFAKPTGGRSRVPASTAAAVSSGQAVAVSDVSVALDGKPADPIAALGLAGGGAARQAAGPAPVSPGAEQAPALAQAPGGSGQTAAPGAPLAGQAPPGRRFTGAPISLDFQGADLRAVLRAFAENNALNIVIDPQVQGSVDVSLRDVPWDQALDIILRANKLGYVVDGTIVRIAPITVLAAEEKERSDLAKAQAEAGELVTLTRQLSYSKGEDMVTLLKQANILSTRGQAFVDARTNTLIVTDLQERLSSTSELLNTLDRPQPQVEIEARIVQTNKNYARQLGIQWGFNGTVSPALGNTTPLAFPNSGSVGGRTGATQGPRGGAASSTAVNLPATGASSAVGLQLGSINGAFNLDVALSALETTGNGRLLSTPKVSTLNTVTAEIVQGVQIPIQTVANNTVTVQFRDAALILRVTPQITAANTVIMQIALENATPDFSRQINNIPPINTQRAATTLLVADGQTTVIGGIYTSTATTTTDSTPGLSRIPLFGWLFKRDAVNDANTELLIFITPRIIRG